eukprot:3824179-Pyramimonas_sp.AAC.1
MAELVRERGGECRSLSDAVVADAMPQSRHSVLPAALLSRVCRSAERVRRGASQRGQRAGIQYWPVSLPQLVLHRPIAM